MTFTYDAGLGPIRRAKLVALPKVDLHRHLEGSFRLRTLAEIAREHGLDLPSHDVERLRPLVQVTDDLPDFHSFLAKFDVLRRFYSTREAIERIAREAVLDAAADNVRYLELRFSPLSLAKSQGFSLEQVTEWVVSSVARAQQEAGIAVRLLLTVIRGCDLCVAQEVVDLAAAYGARGVVGVDLAGDEAKHPAQPLAHLFRKAREMGLGVTIHAGEVLGAESVRTAIESLGAQRIGHGVRARDEESVVRLIRQSGTALEMCLTSNVQTGAVAHLGRHPLPDYHRAGLLVTVNTDDPNVSNTTLSDEYHLVLSELGMTWNELRDIVLNGVRAAFLPDVEKKELEQQFQRAIVME